MRLKNKRKGKKREPSSSLYVCFLWFIEHKASLLHHITILKKSEEKKSDDNVEIKTRTEPEEK